MRYKVFLLLLLFFFFLAKTLLYSQCEMFIIVCPELSDNLSRKLKLRRRRKKRSRRKYLWQIDGRLKMRYKVFFLLFYLFFVFCFFAKTLLYSQCEMFIICCPELSDNLSRKLKLRRGRKKRSPRGALWLIDGRHRMRFGKVLFLVNNHSFHCQYDIISTIFTILILPYHHLRLLPFFQPSRFLFFFSSYHWGHYFSGS